MIRANWVPDEAPDWFWDMIAQAAGDRERFKALADALPDRDLRDAYDVYKELAGFVTSPDLDDDEAGDIANWIVAQGKNYFFDVYERVVPSPDAIPNEAGVGFLGALVIAFMDRHGVSPANPKAPR